MKLRRTTEEQVAGRREARRREADLPIVPGFYAGLAAEAEPFLIVEGPALEPTPSGGAGGAPAAPETEAAEAILGYALLLGREHDGHTHTTLIELGLDEGHRDRYEDVLDVIRDEAKPTAYLVRTDDCRLNATLLSRGLQVEASALVLVPEESTVAAPGAAAAPARAAANSAAPAAAAERRRARPPRSSSWRRSGGLTSRPSRNCSTPRDPRPRLRSLPGITITGRRRRRRSNRCGQWRKRGRAGCFSPTRARRR